MAGLFFVASPDPITVTTGAGPLTYVQIVAAANHRVLLHELDIGFNGVTAADTPTRLQLVTQSTAGSGGSALTLAKVNAGDDETLQTTALHTITTTPTTTASTIRWQTFCHGQNGITRIFPTPLVIPGGTRLGLQWITGTVTGTVLVAIALKLEE